MRKIVSFDRLRSRVASFFGRKGQYMWAETPVDPDELMEHVSRREVGSEAEMRAAMDALIVDPLDVSRPLWDITVLTLSPGASWAPSPGCPPRPPRHRRRHLARLRPRAHLRRRPRRDVGLQAPTRVRVHVRFRVGRPDPDLLVLAL